MQPQTADFKRHTQWAETGRQQGNNNISIDINIDIGKESLE